MIAGQIHRRIEIHFVQWHRFQLDVFGKVDQHGARSSSGGDVKGFLHNPRHVADAGDHVVMFGDRAANFHHRGFLKRISADDRLGNLACDRDQRDTVQLGVGDAGHQIGRSWPAGCHHHAGLAGGPGDSLSRKAAALFVSRQNRTNVVALLAQGLMQGHAAAARIGINRVCPQPNEHLDQNLGTVNCLSCFFNGSQRRDFLYRVFKIGWTFKSNSRKTTKDKNVYRTIQAGRTKYPLAGISHSTTPSATAKLPRPEEVLRCQPLSLPCGS